MKFPTILILLILAVLPAIHGFSQNKQDNVCYINNNRIYFQLDKRWPEAKRKEISSLFSLDSTLIELAFKGEPAFVYDSIPWQVDKIDADIFELSKALNGHGSAYNPNDLFLLDDRIFMLPVNIGPIFSQPKKYGVNSFAKNPTVEYNDSSARFILNGYLKVGQVFLSGTFNTWSTMQNPMSRTESGWEISIKLGPGRYLYKFIVDGKWITDPGNLKKENDQRGGHNSVVYIYNHIFTLNGFPDARKVYVSGNFNGWKKKDLRMKPVPGGWELPLYLDQGTHAYKFLVDGLWITDPGNKTTHADAWGNVYSFIGIGDTLIFRLHGYSTARSVVLSGSFNSWSYNELVMNKTADGWELPYVLGAGNYEYKFIVDGTWMPDPDNPNTTGSGNFTNSCITFKPNHTFTLEKFADAKKVIVTGSFNNWREDSFAMIFKNGTWTYPVYLKPGKYTYKFIVDGKWMIDPANEYWEENLQGTGNSVLWIEP